MQLNRLTLYNFKNLAPAELCFSGGINCFVGNNGEGKTNLLDAIHYLSFTRSHLRGTDAETVCHGETQMSLRGCYTADDGQDLDLLLQYRCGERKTLTLNGKTYRRFSDHIGRIPLVLVTPIDQNLIDGQSEGRRKFLDSIISQYNPTYLASLIRYAKALDSRNALLRSESPIDDGLLTLYEEQMDKEAALIYDCRRAMVEQFAPIFADVYARLAPAREEVNISLLSHISDGSSLANQLHQSRPRDQILGYTTRGPHRDDLQALLCGYPVRHEGSQGQRKTYALALRLAQYQYLFRQTALPTPLLLLDDIFATLDPTRLSLLLQFVATSRFGQIFLTDTGAPALREILSSIPGNHLLFNVKQGIITPQVSSV